MITILKGVQVYSPAPVGTKTVVVAGSTIHQISSDVDAEIGLTEIDEIDLEGKLLVPGLVDSLVHITGGGGEAGFTSRTPELNFSEAVKSGVTTLVGALGTDSVTRNIESLLAKAREFSALGLTVYCHTGSYHLPAKTLTGSVEKDIVWIPEIAGVGEVAIADHRTNQPTVQEIASLAAEARVAGMISGKAGVVSVHVGDGASRLDVLVDVVKHTDIPITQFYPTHINRNKALLEAGIEYALLGGYIDFTTSTTEQLIALGEVSAAKALKYALDRGVPVSRVSLSSDGNASLPHFNNEGVTDGMGVGKTESLWQAVKSAVKDFGIPLSNALAAASVNPANILQLTSKGAIKVGGDADLLVLDAESLEIESVMAGGKWLMRNNEVLVQGFFE